MSDFGSAFRPIRPVVPTHDERQHNEIVDALIGIQVAQDQMVQVLVAMAEAERVAPVIHAAGDGADLSPLLEALSRPHPIPPSPEAIAEALARRLPDHGPLLSAVSEAVANTAKQLERLNKKVTGLSVMPSGGASGHVIVDSGNIALSQQVDLSDRAGRLVGHVTVDAMPANDVGLTDAELRNSPVPVVDRNASGEVLAQQSGAGAVLTFTFASAVDLVVVECDGLATDVARADPFGGTPTATAGIPCRDETPVFIPVTTASLKVFAPTASLVNVWGVRK